jgi:Transglutaminase-like superfamily
MKHILWLLFVLLLTAGTFWLIDRSRATADDANANVSQADRDTDGDGLSDYQEIHKYCTDAKKKDTVGDGVADSDWQRRREFTYSVRAVIRVMPPYNLKAVNDDYQDVRVLRETKDYAELEVVLYPLNTNASAIEANTDWKKDYAGMKEYLAPGVTTNWDTTMQKDLLAALSADGIEPDKLTDKEVVEKVSRWLYARSTYKSMFCTNYVHFPEGKPAIYPGLEKAFERVKGNKDWSATEQFEHELLGKEMFYNKTHGSCTSSAVYEATVLRALGVPTRIITAIPVADASDPDQVALVRKSLTHNEVRSTATLGLLAAGDSYANHTFLEVFVGRRWRRLNYAKLGQNILDATYLGLMIHVHTFNDLSEANLAPTWGARYGLSQRDAEFKHSNPYRTLELSDHFGRFAKVQNPPAKEHKQITITHAYWADAADTPDDLRQSAARHTAADGSPRFFIHGDEWWDDAGDYLQYKVFMQQVDRQFVLRAKDQPEVKATVTMSFFTNASTKLREMEVAIPKEEYAKMVKGVTYSLNPVNGVKGYEWRVKEDVRLSKPLSLEERLDKIVERLEKIEKRLDALEKKP